MASLDLPHFAGATEVISDPSESITEGGIATDPALAEFKTVMETFWLKLEIQSACRVFLYKAHVLTSFQKVASVKWVAELLSLVKFCWADRLLEFSCQTIFEASFAVPWLPLCGMPFPCLSHDCFPHISAAGHLPVVPFFTSLGWSSSSFFGVLTALNSVCSPLKPCPSSVMMVCFIGTSDSHCKLCGQRPCLPPSPYLQLWALQLTHSGSRGMR